MVPRRARFHCDTVLLCRLPDVSVVLLTGLRLSIGSLSQFAHLRCASRPILSSGDALAPNIEALVIIRFIAGTFAASPLTNCGGVIADIWDAVGRGPAMSFFSASVFLGKSADFMLNDTP